MDGKDPSRGARINIDCEPPTRRRYRCGVPVSLASSALSSRKRGLSEPGQPATGLEQATSSAWPSACIHASRKAMCSSTLPPEYLKGNRSRIRAGPWRPDYRSLIVPPTSALEKGPIVAKLYTLFGASLVAATKGAPESDAELALRAGVVRAYDTRAERLGTSASRWAGAAPTWRARRHRSSFLTMISPPRSSRQSASATASTTIFARRMAYIFAIQVPIAGLALIPLLFGLPLVFWPLHIAFLELGHRSDALSRLRGGNREADIMRRPPRNPEQPFFGIRHIARALAQGALVLAFVAGLFALALRQGLPEADARALAFAALSISASSSSTAREAPRYGRRSIGATWHCEP